MWAADRMGKVNRKMRVLLGLVCIVALLGTGCGRQRAVETEPVEAVQTENRSETEPVAIQNTDIEAVRIAVIDTGFSKEAIPEEKREEGKNYVEPEGSAEDTYGHGTAVASVILSENENVVLVPLVSNVYEKGKLRQVENDTLAQMIREAVDVYQCRIINISAGLVLDKEAVREAVEYAREQGVLVVASAGNDYDVNGAVKYYPAGYDSVLAVGALTKDGTEVASFSQRGDWVNCYEIGEAVTIKTLSGKTRESDGTSYAAAKITAKAAELMQEEPMLTVNELQEMLEAMYVVERD